MHEALEIDAADPLLDRHRLLVDSITDYAIYMLDRHGRVSSWNPGARRFKGYEESEILGQHFNVFYTEEERATGVPELALAQAREQGRCEREGWRVRKDGTRFWAHVVIDPVRSSTGAVIGYAKITRDLTERRAAEQALRATQEQFRLLVQGVTDHAIYMLDRSGRVTNWNAGARRIKGYAPEEVIGQPFSRFYTNEDRQVGRPAEALRIAREKGRFETEGWRIRKDGSRFWAHVVIEPIRDEAGELIGFAKITRDITERKRTEETLHLSEQQFRLLIQGVTDYAIYMLDPTGRVTNWNAGAERIKGYAPHEIIGSHFSRFYIEEEREAGAPTHALRTAAEEGRFESEGWRVRKDGSRFWAHVVIHPIRSDTGVLLGFAKITRDITERIAAQRKLEEARESLLQAQKLDAVGQLTGGVAHDFNNLLMAVMGSLELLRKHLPPTPQAVALLENAVQGAQRGAALTQRMLVFARQQELTLQAVDVAELVRGMLGLIERSVGPLNKVVLRLERRLPQAFTEANMLETSLLNLALNARDAMPGGGRITLAANATAICEGEIPGLPPGCYVRLSVADTGQGMDAETLARATEPFFTTKGVGKGTGLGLSMVHGLAEQSGGKLRLSSRPGEGCRVEIWLPEALAKLADAAPERGRNLTPLPSLRILAVDDDALVLMNTIALLEDLDHRVTAATCASEALACLLNDRFDLVITDFAMPEMNGAELAREIHQRWPWLPVILSSGYAELPDDMPQQLPRLAKPYAQADLKAILDTVMLEPPSRWPP